MSAIIHPLTAGEAREFGQFLYSNSRLYDWLAAALLAASGEAGAAGISVSVDIMHPAVASEHDSAPGRTG